MSKSAQQASFSSAIILSLCLLLGVILLPMRTPEAPTAEGTIKTALLLSEPMPESPAQQQPERLPVPSEEPLPEPVHKPVQQITHHHPKAHPKTIVKPIVTKTETQTALTYPSAEAPATAMPIMPTQSQTVDTQASERALQTYRALIVSMLAKHKEYPRLSRRLGEEGTVRIRFTVNAQGQVSTVDVISASGYQRLDKATLAIFEQLNMQLPAFLDGMDNQPITFELPVHYQLSTAEKG